MEKRLLHSLAFLLCALFSMAQGRFCVGMLHYEVLSETGRVAHVYDTSFPWKEAVSVDIPETVSYNGKDYTVIAIGANAFASCCSLQAIKVLGVAYRQAQADGLPCTMSYYYDTYQPTVGFFEIMAEGASKAAALKSLVAETGAERVVVFGDSANDLSMREVADLFIAPANADEKVKAVADEVIGTNDDDSVARWIAADCGLEI